MNIPAILIASLLTLSVGFLVLRPLFDGSMGAETGRASRSQAEALRRRAALLNRRRELYAALRDLDFDYSLDKVALADYSVQRYRLVREATEVLSELDQFPAIDADDTIERAVRAVLAGQDAPAPGGAFCPNCGEPFAPADRFCGSCGQPLKGKVSHARS